MDNDPLKELLKETGEKGESPVAVYFRERERRRAQLGRRLIFGAAMTGFAIFYVVSTQQAATETWHLMFAVTVALVVVFFTWIIASTTMLIEWETAEAKKLTKPK